MSGRYTSDNHIKLVHSGKDFFSTIRSMIGSARHSIHLQTYIFSEDETGKKVAGYLIAAASRQVEVFVLADGFASQGLSDGFIADMKNAGVHFRFFEPIFHSRSLYFGRRLHHKIVVVDGICSLVGGLNIADRYNETKGIPAWFDLALYSEGDTAATLQRICQRLWSKKERFKKIPPVQPALLSKNAEKRDIPVRVRRNDWVKRQQEITLTYSELFRSAKQNLTIVGSYFLPGAKFRLLLKKATARGVRIKVVLASVSDIATSKYAERYLYRWMLRHNIEIYEYQPAVLHAKVALADDALLTIGSYNINNISRYASIELNLDVKDRPFVTEVRREIDQLITDKCKPVTAATYKTALFSLKQFLQWAAFQLVRITMTVSTFYYKQRE